MKALIYFYILYCFIYMKTFRRKSRKNKITQKAKRGQYRRRYRGGVSSNGRYSSGRSSNGLSMDAVLPYRAPANRAQVRSPEPQSYSAPPPSTRSSHSSSDVEMEEAPPLEEAPTSRVQSGTRKKQKRRNSKTRQKKFFENTRAARAQKVNQKRKDSPEPRTPQPRTPPPLPPAPGLYPTGSDDFDSTQVPMGRRVRTGERGSNSSHIPMGIPV